MKGLLKFLIGSPEAAGKAADALYSGLDKIAFTAEEKADAAQKSRDWLNDYMAATNGQNVARRLIALIVTSLWAVLLVLSVVLHLCGATVRAEWLFGVIDEVVTPAFMLVITFYFAAGAILRRNQGVDARQK